MKWPTGKFVDSIEKGGFRAANVVHKVAVSGLIFFTLYSFYAMSSDYRHYFKIRKDPAYKEAIEA
jgi:hypothetical protein